MADIKVGKFGVLVKIIAGKNRGKVGRYMSNITNHRDIVILLANGEEIRTYPSSCQKATLEETESYMAQRRMHQESKCNGKS